MASPAISASDIRLLAQQSTAYWADEASVNGIWLGLLAKAFPGSDGFVLQPEGRGEGSMKRNDILVRKITNFNTGDQTGYLVFEGKKSGGDSLDTAAKQLLDFVEKSPKLSHENKLWGIVARGNQYRLLFFQDKTQFNLLLPNPDPNNANSGKPSHGVPYPDYTLADGIVRPGCVENVELFLAYAKDHLTDFLP